MLMNTKCTRSVHCLSLCQFHSDQSYSSYRPFWEVFWMTLKWPWTPQGLNLNQFWSGQPYSSYRPVIKVPRMTPKYFGTFTLSICSTFSTMDIKLPLTSLYQRATVRTLITTESGYLPNSPYTMTFGVDDFIHIYLQNFRCNISKSAVSS